MAIATAVHLSGMVYVYDERGNEMFSKPGTLHGFTPEYVSVRVAGLVNVYDAKGIERFHKPAN